MLCPSHTKTQRTYYLYSTTGHSCKQFRQPCKQIQHPCKHFADTSMPECHHRAPQGGNAIRQLSSCAREGINSRRSREMNDPINVRWIANAVQADYRRAAARPSVAEIAWREAALGSSRGRRARDWHWPVHLQGIWPSIRRLWSPAQSSYAPTDAASDR